MWHDAADCFQLWGHVAEKACFAPKTARRFADKGHVAALKASPRRRVRQPPPSGRSRGSIFLPLGIRPYAA